MRVEAQVALSPISGQSTWPANSTYLEKRPEVEVAERLLRFRVCQGNSRESWPPGESHTVGMRDRMGYLLVMWTLQPDCLGCSTSSAICQPCANQVTSMSFDFLICKIGVKSTTLKDCCLNNVCNCIDNAWHIISTMEDNLFLSRHYHRPCVPGPEASLNALKVI